MPVSLGTLHCVPSTSKLTIERARRIKHSVSLIGIAPNTRGFRRSAYAQTHYDTLSLPHNANKGQIKSSYYKLSKQYHPDLNKDPASKERFQKVGEAYAVLGDDRKRRAYDRSLAGSAGPRYFASSAGTSHAHGYWAYETRRRPGATHAWSSAKRPASGHHHPNYTPPGSPPYTHPKAAPQYHQDPFASPNVQRATGHSRQYKFTGQDRIAQISTFWRAMQVAGIVMLIASIGGGLNAKA